MTQRFVKPENLDIEFDLGNLTANKIRIKLGGALVRQPDGTIVVDLPTLAISDPAGTNLLTTNAAGQVSLTQAAVQSAETAWNGSVAAGSEFLTVTPAGTNGHAPTYSLDYADPAFVEGVQDAMGQAIQNGLGITYDDALNAVNVALQNLAAGDGINISGGIVSVAYSADAGNLAKAGTDGDVMVDPADVTALATVEVCDAFDVVVGNMYP